MKAFRVGFLLNVGFHGPSSRFENEIDKTDKGKFNSFYIVASLSISPLRSGMSGMNIGAA